MSLGLVAKSEYIPKLEALLVQIDMSDYLIDYYHHRQEFACNTSPDHDEKLKELIACFSVHLSARTAQETHAWTVHMQDQNPYSLFVTGNTGIMDENDVARGYLVGHVLTENIKPISSSSIHAQLSRRGKTFNSMVTCDSTIIPAMVTQFYDYSEGYPLRLQLSQTSDTAIGLVALPEYDPEWFANVDLNELVVSQTLSKSHIRTCHFAFSCDCSSEKLLPFIRAMSVDTLEELYGTDTVIDIICPRCGKQFSIARDELAN